jgi:phosphate transport system protein
LDDGKETKDPMSMHFVRELERLKDRMLELCALVEKHLAMAMQALDEWDGALAREVMDFDIKIDEMEVEIEEECLKALALYQPVARDLRLVVATLKINSDLERIGDLTVNIAERTLFMLQAPCRPPLQSFDFSGMAAKACAMLRMSVDALVALDVDMAYAVCRADDEVDAINRDVFRVVKQKMREGDKDGDVLIDLLSISRTLERIADHATNIAEDVVYLIGGDVVRHHVEDFSRAGNGAMERSGLNRPAASQNGPATKAGKEESGYAS